MKEILYFYIIFHFDKIKFFVFYRHVDWDHLSIHSNQESCKKDKSDHLDLKLDEPFYGDLPFNPVKLYQDITKHRIRIEVPG